jgi:hypothetical protein
MSVPFDIKEELILWAQTYGEEKISKQGGLYYNLDYKNGKRARLLIELLEILKELGAEKGYFKTASFKDALIKQCLGPKHIIGNKKHANGTDCLLKELDRAIVKVYGTESQYYKTTGKTRQLNEEKSELEKEAEAQRVNSVEPEESTPREEKEKPFTKVFKPGRKTGEPTVIDNPDPFMDEFLGFKK